MPRQCVLLVSDDFVEWLISYQDKVVWGVGSTIIKWKFMMNLPDIRIRNFALPHQSNPTIIYPSFSERFQFASIICQHFKKIAAILRGRSVS